MILSETTQASKLRLKSNVDSELQVESTCNWAQFKLASNRTRLLVYRRDAEPCQWCEENRRFVGSKYSWELQRPYTSSTRTNCQCQWAVRTLLSTGICDARVSSSSPLWRSPCQCQVSRQVHGTSGIRMTSRHSGALSSRHGSDANPARDCSVESEGRKPGVNVA